LRPGRGAVGDPSNVSSFIESRLRPCRDSVVPRDRDRERGDLPRPSGVHQTNGIDVRRFRYAQPPATLLRASGAEMSKLQLPCAICHAHAQCPCAMRNAPEAHMARLRRALESALAFALPCSLVPRKRAKLQCRASAGETRRGHVSPPLRSLPQARSCYSTSSLTAADAIAVEVSVMSCAS